MQGGLKPQTNIHVTGVGQAMLAMSDTGALLRFVQRPNAASLEEGRAALQAAGRYSELVALYQPRRQHQAALALLRTLSQALASACSFFGFMKRDQAGGAVPAPPAGLCRAQPAVHAVAGAGLRAS